jgi:hypothetical protein
LTGLNHPQSALLGALAISVEIRWSVCGEIEPGRVLILREEKAKLQSSHRDSKRSQNQKRENDTMEMVKDDVKNEKIEDNYYYVIA